MPSRTSLKRRGQTALPFAAACSLACVLSLTHFMATVRAQSTNSPLQGIILDQTGAPIARAQITLRTTAAIIAQALTDAEGRFRIEAETRPDATLSVEAQGFAKFDARLDEMRTNPSVWEIVLAPAPLSEQVTVTATRTETRLADTPASVVSLNATELSTTAALTLDDALRQVPGFTLFRRSGSRTANPTSQGVSLRGTGASGASRAVVLADGVPLNDPFGGWVYWSRIPRTAVKTVEVLRGGASHLYGSAAMGGVINIFTRRTTERAFLLEASYGNQQTADASLFAAGRKSNWGASISAESFHTDGFIIVDEDERGTIDIPANSRSTAAHFTLERTFSSSANVFASVNVFGEARSNGTPLQINRTHLRQFVTGGEWQTARAGAFSWRAYGGTQVFDQNFTAVSADRSLETLTRVQRVPSQSAGFSLQWSRAISERQTLVAGLEARAVRGASDEIAYLAGRPTSLIGAGGRERTIGVYIEDIIRLTPGLYLTAGARLDHWRNYRAHSTTRPFSATAAPTVIAFPDRSETAFSPHLSLLYKPAENLSLYASMTRAFRQPTLNELYRSFRVGDALTLANENLRAERFTGGEAGINHSSFARKLNVRAALFWAEMTRPVANVTLTVAPGLITRQRQNLGRTRSRGLELEWDARLTNRLTVSGGYLLADATVLGFPVNRQLEGLRLPQVARHQLTFQARYVNPRIMTLALQGRASGAQYDDDQNRFRLKRFLTLDAYASRSLKHNAEAFLAFENIFNQRYTTGLTPVRTIGPPLLVRFGLRLRLGLQ
jgi:outer membrane receptor protein involved in Fe transport